MKCKKCEISFDVNMKLKVNVRGFCTKSCFSSSDEYKLQVKKTVVEKSGQATDNLTAIQIREIYHKIRSEQIKKTQAKRVNTIKKKGAGEFSRMTKLGSYNRKVKFLKEHDLISDIEDVLADEINLLFLKYFNYITSHGNKIKRGISEKYGNDTSVYKKGFVAQIQKIMSDNKCDILEANRIRANSSLRVNGISGWKRVHVERYMGKDCSFLTEKEINNFYSEYLSGRFELTENAECGWKRTKKGWYTFNNIEKRMFYRSSWEECVFETIDIMIKQGTIVDVRVPRSVKYFMDYNRKYYPDVEYTLSTGITITVEIKPKSKVNDAMNVKKFEVAFKEYDTFIILTEDDIFNNNLTEILTKAK